jgi:hypothetical protein
MVAILFRLNPGFARHMRVRLIFPGVTLNIIALKQDQPSSVGSLTQCSIGTQSPGSDKNVTVADRRGCSGDKWDVYLKDTLSLLLKLSAHVKYVHCGKICYN